MTSPTLIPLNRTSEPADSPATGPLKRISIGRPLVETAGVVEPVDEADDPCGDGEDEQTDQEIARANFHWLMSGEGLGWTRRSVHGRR